MAQNLNNPINRAGGPVDDRTEVQHESDIDSLESTYVGQLVHVRDNDKFFRIKSVDVLGSPTSKEVVAYTEITSDKIASWNGKQDAITPANTLSPNNIKDATMHDKLAAYNNNGVLGNSGISTNDVAVKSEMSITDGTAADAGTATIQLKSGTSKKVLTEHQSLEGKVDKVPGKVLSTNDYDNTEKTKVAKAIQTPSATENGKIPVMRNGAIEWENKPSDGQDGAQGPQGEAGHNPCLGRFTLTPSPMPTAQVGDYLYVDTTTTDPNTQEETTTTTVYHYGSNGWDSGTVIDAEHPTLASGQSVTAVHIKDENGDDDPNTQGVLSAEAGAELNEKKLDKVHQTTSYEAISADQITNTYVSSSGTSSSTGAKTSFFPVTQGKKYKIKGRFGTSTLYWLYAYYNEGTHIQLYDQYNSTAFPGERPVVEKEITVPTEGTITHVAVTYYDQNANNYSTCEEIVVEETDLEETILDAKERVDGIENDLTETSADLAETKTKVSELDEEANGIHIPAYSEDVSESVSPSASLSTWHNLTNSLTAGRKYHIVIDGNSPVSTSHVDFRDSEGNAIPFYLNSNTTTYNSYNPAAGGAYGDAYVVLTKDCVAIGLYVSNSHITTSGTLTYHITSEAYDEEGRFTKEFLECDKKKRDITDALAIKELIQKDRPYYFDEYFKFNESNGQWYQDTSGIDSYEDNSYLEQRIADIPEGKHFIFTTDSHIDYYNLFKQQNETPIIKYVRDRAGIKNVVFGGDAIGGTTNRYTAAKILSTYANDKFNAFGSDFIYCQGNHDTNSPGAMNAARQAISGGASDDAIKQAIFNGFISCKEVAKRTFDYMKVYGYAVFDEKLFDVIDNFDFTNYGNVSITVSSNTYSLNVFDFGYTNETLREEFKAWAMQHYYYDDDSQKIRYIVIDTWDYSICARQLGSGFYSGGMLQLQFVADALASTKEGYDVVVVGHEIDSYHTLGASTTIMNLISAYKNKSTAAIKNIPVYNSPLPQALFIALTGLTLQASKTIDFSNRVGSGRVLCISGHYHINKAALVTPSGNNNGTWNSIYLNPSSPISQSTINDAAILSILTDRATAGGRASTVYPAEQYAVTYPDDVKANEGVVVSGVYEQRVGTVNEVLFDVVTITDDNMVYVTRFGGGGSENDRAFTLPMPVE